MKINLQSAKWTYNRRKNIIYDSLSGRVCSIGKEFTINEKVNVDGSLRFKEHNSKGET